MLAGKPRILLVEDDAITREVVLAHLLALGCRVDAATQVSQAIDLGSRQAFDALVLDCQLGDGDAPTLLRTLREAPGGPNQRTAAIAMSAELDDVRFDSLIECGFADAMEKPIHRSRLRHALSICGISGLTETRHAASADAASEAQVLDDAAGLQACGSNEVLMGLRLLLAQELPVYSAQLQVARSESDAAMLRACVHRMRSALGFCGARELLDLLNESETRALEPAVFASWQAAIDRLMLRLSSLSG
jgi:CheY-like chemotaxis protein